MTVRNGSTSAISGWTARWTYTSGERITQTWGATFAQSGAAVTADNTPGNGTLAPGATATFGFLGTGTPATPPVICTSRSIPPQPKDPPGQVPGESFGLSGDSGRWCRSWWARRSSRRVAGPPTRPR